MATKHSNRGRVGVGLFVLGSLAFAVGTWMPWMIYTGIGYYGPGLGPALSFTPGDQPTIPVLVALGDYQFVAVAWALLTILGVALGPLVMASAPSWLSRLGHILAGLWLLGVSALVTIIVVQVLRGAYGPQAPVCASANCLRLSSTSSSPQIGLVVIFAGLALAWIGWALAFRGIWQGVGVERPASAVTSSRMRRLKVGLLGTGIVLWALGYYLMPWATYECGPVWFVGTCTGYPANDMATFGLPAQGALDSAIMIHAVPFVLGVGAIYLLAALGWRGFVIRAAQEWLAAWLVVASATAWLGVVGVNVFLHVPDNTNHHIGTPYSLVAVGPGIAVTIVGLILLALGLVVAILSLVSRPSAAEPVPSGTSSGVQP